MTEYKNAISIELYEPKIKLRLGRSIGSEDFGFFDGRMSTPSTIDISQIIHQISTVFMLPNKDPNGIRGYGLEMPFDDQPDNREYTRIPELVTSLQARVISASLIDVKYEGIANPDTEDAFAWNGEFTYSGRFTVWWNQYTPD